MKQILLIAALFTISISTWGQTRKDYAETITADGIKQHLMILASDEYEGRETGKPGQKKAAKYISNHFKEIGLEGPINGSENPYYQPVPLTQTRWGDFYVKSKSGKSYKWMEDFYQIGDFSIAEQKLEIVFAGYGIDGDNYSDYKGLDVKGKAVVLINDKASKSIATKVNDQKIVDKNASPYDKLKTAISKGAILVIMISNNDKEVTGTISRYGKYITSPKLRFGDQKPKDRGGIVALKSMTSEIVGIKEKKLDKLIKKYKSGASLPKFSSGTMLTIKAEKISDPLPTENVLGFLEGTDLRDEVLVVTAHYDHIGINEKGEINNGADDDGSGTSTLLEIAEAFAKAKAAGNGPRRSILFMTVTGEEKGLLGSEYYSDHPIYPIESTVTNLNIDMIGRIDKEHKDKPNYVYIIGSDMLSSDLHTLSESVQATHASDIKLDYRYNDKDDPNRFYYRSDHYNFAKHDIPVIFYFTGVHEDYHKPTDTPDKIMYTKTARIAKLIFHTAWELANSDDRVMVDKPTKED